LVKKPNDTLFKNHPFIHKVLVWDKKQSKGKELNRLIKEVKKQKYDTVINLHRFFSSGLITAMSGAKHKIGFDKNPLSRFYTKKVNHKIEPGIHEVDRNQKLIEHLTDAIAAKPKLYPSAEDTEKVNKLKNDDYYCIAPSSVWFTKQLPIEKWNELIQTFDKEKIIYLLGGVDDNIIATQIVNTNIDRKIINLCGTLSFLESAALMKDAKMNYVNDSAPLHFASSVNANVSAVYCSTIPEFGFGPLSDNSTVIQINKPLSCRPCGLHGKKECPEGHFKCALDIVFS
jgi:ADP-heptose:LPS heptosyltransferase